MPVRIPQVRREPPLEWGLSTDPKIHLIVPCTHIDVRPVLAVMGVGCGGDGCGGCLGLKALGYLLHTMTWGCIGASSAATGTAIGSILQAFANPTGQPPAEACGMPMGNLGSGMCPMLNLTASGLTPPEATLPARVTAAELQARQKEYRDKVSKAVKPLQGGRGVFAQASAIYESQKSQGSSAVDELKIQDALNEGEQLVLTLERKKASVDAWNVKTVNERSAEIDDLLEELVHVRERIAQDVMVCKTHKTQASLEANKRKRKMAAETRRHALLLGGVAGELTDTLVGIVRPGLDDPGAFEEKGIIKDPVDFTQAEVAKCVHFGWNGVLLNADMCHHPRPRTQVLFCGHPRYAK